MKYSYFRFSALENDRFLHCRFIYSLKNQRRRKYKYVHDWVIRALMNSVCIIYLHKNYAKQEVRATFKSNYLGMGISLFCKSSEFLVKKGCVYAAFYFFHICL